jgi:hypothetical protein
MIDDVRDMVDLALRKEPQGIHFWGTVYVLVVLVGSLWHVLRVRRWPSVDGELVRLGIRPLGVPDPEISRQDHVPDALYRYQVDGTWYEGRELSVWKMSASGLLKGAAHVLPRQVRADPSGRLRVFHHPKRPAKSLLLRPGWGSVLFLAVSIAATAGLYLWRW